MKTIINKTISTNLGSEDYIIALMQKISFKEICRFITGGQMGSEKIIITFEGYDIDYKENDFVRKLARDDYYYYYSLRVPEGYYTNDFKYFKNIHDKSAQSIDVFSF